MSKVRTWSDHRTSTAFVLGLVLATAIGAATAWGSDPLGEQELTAGRDPSFTSVSSHYPAMKRPREVIGVKEHRDEFIIMPDGRVHFMSLPEEHRQSGHEYILMPDGRPNRVPLRKYYDVGYAFFAPGESDTWLGTDDDGRPAKKRLMDGYLPIVIAEFERDGLEYEQTAVAWSEGMSADEPLWAFVRLKVSNSSDRSRETRLNWNIDHGIKTRRKVRNVTSWHLKLAPGAEQTVYGKLPFMDSYEKAVQSSAEEFESRLGEARAFWKRLLNQGIRINVPEQRVNDAYRAWLAYTFLNVDKIGEVYEPHDGSGFYEAIYGIMAAKYCNALDLMGYPQEARTYLDSLATLISPEGLFFVSFGIVDTGSLLLAMDEHYQLTGDQAWLRAAAPKIIKMCDWIIKKRKEARAGQEEGSLCYGLIACRMGVDNANAGYNFVTDTLFCTAMEAAAKSLRAAGTIDEAARVEKECDAYRQDIERSMRRSVIEHDGMKALPILPETHGYLNKTHQYQKKAGYSGAGYYTLFAGIVLETKFLPASDERFRLIGELVEQRRGLLLGMCLFGSDSDDHYHGLIDHAFTYGYWMNCLERGEVERVLLGFYGSLAYGMSRETWSGVELTNILTGENQHTLPHLRSGTQQLRLLRNMLVREQGDRLILAQAAPQHWLADGKQVQVLDAPTHFGKVSYTIDSRVNQGQIVVQLDPPGRKPPRAIVLYLRHPEKAKIKSVSVDGKPVEQFDERSVTLEGLVRPARIEVRYH